MDEDVLELEGENLTVRVSGNLDTLRAIRLDEAFSDLPDTVKSICFDFQGLEYIASSGLRLLYWAHQYTGEKGGSMVVRHVSPRVMEVLEVTGFRGRIRIEEEQ